MIIITASEVVNAVDNPNPKTIVKTVQFSFNLEEDSDGKAENSSGEYEHSSDENDENNEKIELEIAISSIDHDGLVTILAN